MSLSVLKTGLLEEEEGDDNVLGAATEEEDCCSGSGRVGVDEAKCTRMECSPRAGEEEEEEAVEVEWKLPLAVVDCWREVKVEVWLIGPTEQLLESRTESATLAPTSDMTPATTTTTAKNQD